MEQHMSSLSLLCRYCGKRVDKPYTCRKGYMYEVPKYQDKVKERFNIDITKDIPDIHPQKFCKKCYHQIIKAMRRTSNWTPKNNWEPHGGMESCTTCTLFKQSQLGGRNKKMKYGGRPPNSVMESHFASLGPSQETPKYKIIHPFRLDTSRQFLICCVCDSVVSCPVEAPCNHLFCLDCITPLFVNVSISCPLCILKFHYSKTHTPPEHIIILLQNLHVLCSHCNKSVHYTKTAHHFCPNADHTYAKRTEVDLDTRQCQQIAPDLSIKDQIQNSSDGMSTTIGSPEQGKDMNVVVIPSTYNASDKSILEEDGYELLCVGGEWVEA